MSEIQHHGVKGMKWGVRKKDRSVPGPASGGNAKKIGRAKNPAGAEEALRSVKTGMPVKGKSSTSTSSDGRVTRTTTIKKQGREVKQEVYKDIRKKKGSVLDTLTNDELRRTIERMQLEKQYRELSSMDLTPGQKIRKKMMNRAVDTLVERGVSAAVNAAMNQVSKKSGVYLKSLAKAKKK